MGILTFRVFPGGVGFDTSEGPPGDTNGAFEKAHHHAATEAARSKAPHYVFRDDMGTKRLGFGNFWAGALRRISSYGYKSCWDFATDSWVPLEEETEGETVQAVTKA
jgi:hypothetical protein